MAEVPALDTSEISFIAYWNVETDGGGPSTISFEEATSAMETHKLYDDGVDGTITVNFARRESRFVNCRVRENGWIVTWIDRRKAGDPDIHDRHGVHDVINDWSERTGNINPYRNKLERAVARLHGELSASSETTYEPRDVGLYNYEHPDARTITMASVVARFRTKQIEVKPIGDAEVVEAYVAGPTTRGARWITASGESHDITDDVRRVTDDEFRSPDGTAAKVRVSENRGGTGHLMILWK